MIAVQVLLCGAFAVTPAHAALTIGIADQNLRPADPLFAWTGIRTVRLIVPWDAGLRPTPELDARLDEARDAGLDMLVAFEHRRGEDCRTGPCALPTPDQLREAFVAFRARWPWVTAFGAWNEGNHPSQPTAARPAAAAALYQALATTCPDCRIAAADVVDIAGMATWVRAFLAALPEAPRLWGLHNYSDVMSGQATMTETMLRLVPGDVWITETGGIVRWGRWPYDEERAAEGVARAFAIADAHPDRISRLYLYQWRTAPWEAWDSGLLRPDGTPRPGFSVLAARV
ncbi:MAG TPA: glycosyl hydrolase, partial [Solirubrobacter sp.]